MTDMVTDIDEETVERVARALCRQYELDDGFSVEQADRAAASDMYRNFVKSARAALAAMPSQWRPIDSAPRDGTDILLYCPPVGKFAEENDIGRWNQSLGQWQMPDHQCGGYGKCDPTHWMPRPAPPKPESRR